MDLARGCRAKDQNKIIHSPNGAVWLNSDLRLVIKFPDSRVLRVLSRSVFLAMVIITVPCIISILRGLTSSYYSNAIAYDLTSESIEFLDLLLQDLAHEGLIKKGDKAFIVNSGTGAVIDYSRFLNPNGVDLVLESDFNHESLFPNAAFDFAVAFGIEDTKSVDRKVKVGGIVVTQLSNDVSNAFQNQPNYRIVYLKRYNSTIVGLRKTSMVNESVDSSANRRLCQLSMEAKNSALNGLESVLLEPPRKALTKSSNLLKNFNYLPDLLGDSLEHYARRVFVDVGSKVENSDVMTWFKENYPTKNQEFEIYNIKMVPEGDFRRVVPLPRIDVSNWLRKNVRKDEFVVMKAEAEEVEDLMKTGTIELVDELFLECDSQWQNGERRKSKRAYWECVALYGRLIDGGVAVHQWWG